MPVESSSLETFQVKESVKTLEGIRNFLANFTVPDESIITLAREYIQAIRTEQVEDTEHESEPFKKTTLKGLYRKFGGCVGCGGGVYPASSRTDNILQPHHILPSEFGGKATTDNAMIVCRDCHVRIHS